MMALVSPASLCSPLVPETYYLQLSLGFLQHLLISNCNFFFLSFVSLSKESRLQKKISRIHYLLW